MWGANARFNPLIDLLSPPGSHKAAPCHTTPLSTRQTDTLEGSFLILKLALYSSSWSFHLLPKGEKREKIKTNKETKPQTKKPNPNPSLIGVYCSRTNQIWMWKCRFSTMLYAQNIVAAFLCQELGCTSVKVLLYRLLEIQCLKKVVPLLSVFVLGVLL